MERTEVIRIPWTTVEDVIAQHLYTVAKLHDNEDATVTLTDARDGPDAVFELKIQTGGKIN